MIGLANRPGTAVDPTCSTRRAAAPRAVPMRPAIVADMAFVLAERLNRRTQDVVSLLRAAGTRLPVSELERFRSRAVQ